jgi:Ran GTPase-activating protein (RanGAP) involved in mRNA processing and transport
MDKPTGTTTNRSLFTKPRNTSVLHRSPFDLTDTSDSIVDSSTNASREDSSSEWSGQGKKMPRMHSGPEEHANRVMLALTDPLKGKLDRHSMIMIGLTCKAANAVIQSQDIDKSLLSRVSVRSALERFPRQERDRAHARKMAQLSRQEIDEKKCIAYLFDRIAVMEVAGKNKNGTGTREKILVHIRNAVRQMPYRAMPRISPKEDKVNAEGQQEYDWNSRAMTAGAISLDRKWKTLLLDFADLSKGMLDKKVVSILREIQSHAKGKLSLQFQNCKFNQQDMIALGAVHAEKVRLSEINMDSVQMIGKAGIKFAAAMASSKVEKICLVNFNMESGSVFMSTLLSSPSLQVLDLREGYIDAENDPGLITALCSNKSLVELKLIRMYLGEKRLDQIVGALSVDCRLKFLEISEKQMTSDMVEKFLLALTVNTRLECLALRMGKPVVNCGNSVAQMLEKNRHLEKLDLANVLVTSDEAAIVFKSLLRNETLREICIGYMPGPNSSPDSSCTQALIELVRQNWALEVLDLKGFHLSHEDTLAIARAVSLRHSPLQILGMGPEYDDYLRQLEQDRPD